VPQLSPPTRTLPAHPHLDQLKRQAKELLAAFVAGEAAALAEVTTHYRGADAARFALHEAQLVLARAYGFDSWPKLKAFVDGVTVERLIDAVYARDIAGVDAMLSARPELVHMDTAYGDERRALHHAVLDRSPAMVRLLMERGADARKGIYPHRDATSALTLAVERGYEEIVEIIRDAEQQRRATTSGAEPAPALEATPARAEPTEATEAARLRSAVAAGEGEWLRARYAEGTLVNPIDWGTGGLLTVAVEHDRADMLALLLDFGFDPDERVRSGEVEEPCYSQGFPLWQCAARGRHAMAELLLQRGASPNLHVDSSGSPVYSAYSHRQWAMVDMLRRHGGLVSADIVAIYRQTELAREMLASEARGALPVGMVSRGRTLAEDLLDFGASGGDPDIVRMALERIEWTPEDPRWFWMLARPLDFWNHIPWLSSAHPELDRGTYLACFRLVLERCGPNPIGRFGRTVLHEVATMGDHVTAEEGVAFAAALLDAGARVDARDDLLQSTPLGWACRWGRVEVVKLLLDRGADPVEPDAESWATPRAWAAKMGHDAVLAALDTHAR
jgi:ankyrin repeat protein